MLFKETIPLYTKNYTKFVNNFGGQNAECSLFLNQTVRIVSIVLYRVKLANLTGLL
jgi:hypothetical protein